MLTKASTLGLTSGPRTTRRVIPADPDLRPTPWTRPADWLALPAVVAGDQKVVGLYAVHNHASNYVAVIISGACTIDWGDGSAPENFNAGVQANHTFNYAGLGSGTTTTRGYRQAIVTITPQAGQNLTSVSFQAKNPAMGSVSNSVSKWLDIKVAGASISSLSLGAAGLTTTHLALLEAFEFVGPEVITSAASMFAFCRSLSAVVVPSTFLGAACATVASMFNGCGQLQSAPMLDTHLVTTCVSMFNNCYKLIDVPLYDTSAVTTMSSMFNFCFALKNVPRFNTSAVTNMSSMFIGCSMLTQIPAFDTSHVTNMQSMFSSCVSMVNAPQLLSFASCTNAGNLFQLCRSLQNVPAYNFPVCNNVASMFDGCARLTTVPVFTFGIACSASFMFQNCVALKSVPQWPTFHPNFQLNFMFNGCSALVDAPMIDSATVTGFANMFAGCSALRSVPLYNTVLSTTMQNMFNNCFSLLECPAFNTGNVTDFSFMFNGCAGLAVAPALTDTSKGTTFSNTFAGCLSLEMVPAYNLTAATGVGSLGSMFNNCSSLSSLLATNIKVSLTVSSARLAAAALDTIYNNLAVVAGQTITVSNNPGITSDTPTIATGKGWTVTGS